MTHNDISKEVVKKIHQTGTKPVSKRLFQLKNIVFWSLVVIFLLVGSLSFAIIIFLEVTNDWDLFSMLHATFIIQTIPYFWIISFIIFIALGEYYYRKTVLGHRQRLIKIIAVYIAITGIIGAGLYWAGVGQKAEELIEKYIPAYHLVMYDKNAIWSQPDKGLMSGTIKSIHEDGIELTDLRGNTWVIETKSANIRNRVQWIIGEKIKILGKKNSEKSFVADEIRPWTGSGKNQAQ